jgi:hypothetical protein
MEMSDSSPNGTNTYDESLAPLNVFRGNESEIRDLDSPRRERLSTYQVAARQSRSGLLASENLAADEQIMSPDETSKDGQPKFELKTHSMTVGWQRAAFGYFEENTLEQKMWIQSTLTAAKQRGDDWIDVKFRDDKHSNSGCTACLPDIVVVNDTRIQKGSEAFQAKAAAPWQRVWTPAQAEMETKNSYNAKSLNSSPFAAHSMICGQASATSDTYLYDEERYAMILLDIITCM